MRQFTAMPRKLQEKKISRRQNRLKNSNWLEADQLAIFMHNRGIELESTETQLH